jgi:hypothetical protein
MSPLAGSQFTPPCPFCGRDKGRPNSVTMTPEDRIIKYVCRTCDHAWTLSDHVVIEAGFYRHSVKGA